MILSKEVEVKTFKNKKLKHYSNLGYDVYLSIILIKIEDLPKSISVEVQVKCDFCGKEHIRKFVDYNRTCKEGKWACSKECGTLKFKETMLNLNVQNHMKGKKIEPEKLKVILEKRKKTNIEKWGVEHVLQNEEVKEKYKETSIRNWNVDNFSKTEEFIIKQKETCLEKWGEDHHSQNTDIKKKKEETCLEKWGVKSTLHINKSQEKRNEIFRTEEFRKKFEISNHKDYIEYLGDSKSLFMCEKNHKFEIDYDNFRGRIVNNIPLCTICYSISEHRSIKEKELLNYISSIYDKEIIESYRDKYEIDIYLPDLNIGFEFNGIFWHSDKWKSKDYHKLKSDHFKEKGIKIFNIWESDWDFRNSIVKSQILNQLGKSNRIWARKCSVKEITDNKISKEFLDKNHIQGWVRSDLKIGLYYNDELVSIMIFDHYEGRKKMNKDEWNLSRFCNKLDYSVVGGASKILNYFIKSMNPKRIISYADKDWSQGNLYESIGFLLISEINPDYKYVVDGDMIHKSRFRKSLTGVSESELNIPKVWNCGKLKFEKTFNSICDEI